MLLLDGAEAADTGRDNDAHTTRLIFLRADAGVRSVRGLQLRCAEDAALADRLLGGHHGELRIAGHMLLLTTVDDGGRIEVLYLAGELDREVLCIEMGDRADPALSGADGCPGSLCIISGRIYRTETGDDDSTFIHSVLLCLVSRPSLSTGITPVRFHPGESSAAVCIEQKPLPGLYISDQQPMPPSTPST